MFDSDFLLRGVEESVTFKPSIGLYKFKHGLNVTASRASYNISASVAHPYFLEKEQMMEQLISNINSEFSMFLNKSIRNEFHKANNNLFLSIEGLSQFQIIDKLYEHFRYSSYSACVTNGRIASEFLTEHRAFMYSIGHHNLSNYIDCYGSIYGTPVYIDNVIKHTDDAIYLTHDNIFYEVENTRFNIINEATFKPRILISFDFKILANNLFILNLVYKGSSMNDEWIRINREDKIDTILK